MTRPISIYPRADVRYRDGIRSPAPCVGLCNIIWPMQPSGGKTRGGNPV